MEQNQLYDQQSLNLSWVFSCYGGPGSAAHGEMVNSNMGVTNAESCPSSDQIFKQSQCAAPFFGEVEHGCDHGIDAVVALLGKVAPWLACL